MNVPVWLAVAVAAMLTAVIVYLRVFRPWQLTWGATPEEAERPLPSDEVVSDPTFDATRAITIAATPEQIWPWLLQVGVTRAGWYSYDILDNMGRPSAREIVPDLQSLAVGDVMGMSPDGAKGVEVLDLDLPRSMMWGTLPIPPGCGSSSRNPMAPPVSSPGFASATAGSRRRLHSRCWSSSRTSG